MVPYMQSTTFNIGGSAAPREASGFAPSSSYPSGIHPPRACNVEEEKVRPYTPKIAHVFKLNFFHK